MNCPKCNTPMEVTTKEISHNPRDSKQYNRTYYVCKTDDIWVTTEIPVEPPRV
ncbi:MAG TPA: hypothetical protein VMV24_02505 [Candidatus Dormibacteraeota bacterium]|nr:hypothetical protein [Candidatus Dormibacteraeota bacterium]